MRGDERRSRLRDLAVSIQFVSSLLEVVAEIVANDRLHTPLQSILAEADQRAHAVPWMHRKPRKEKKT